MERLNGSIDSSSHQGVLKVAILTLRNDAIYCNDRKQSELSKLSTRVEYFTLGKDHLLLGYGAFIVELRSPMNLDIISRFDTSTLSVFNNPTKCIGMDFVNSIVIDRSQVWVGLALHSCADSSLNHHLVWFEIHQPITTWKAQSIRFPRTYIRSVYFCCKYGDSLILGINDDQKVWTYRQEVKSSFAGPMYPPGFTLLYEISDYIEKEDELDQVIMNDNNSCATIDIDEDEELEVNTSEESSTSHEKPLKRLPLNITSYSGMDDSALSAAETPSIDVLSQRSMLPIPQKLVSADTTRREKETKMREEILKASQIPMLDTRKALLIKASYDAAQREQERRLRTRWRRVINVSVLFVLNHLP